MSSKVLACLVAAACAATVLPANPVLAQDGYWKRVGAARVEKGSTGPVAPGRLDAFDASGGEGQITATARWDDSGHPGQPAHTSRATFSWAFDRDVTALSPGQSITVTATLTHAGESSSYGGITFQPPGTRPGTGHVSAVTLLGGLDNTANRTVTRSESFAVPAGSRFSGGRAELRFEVYTRYAAAVYYTYEWVSGSRPGEGTKGASPHPEPTQADKVPEGALASFRVIRGEVKHGGRTYGPGSKPKVTPWEAIETGPNTRVELTFWDGSVFVIKSHSRVMVPNWGDRERALEYSWRVDSKALLFLQYGEASYAFMNYRAPDGSVRWLVMTSSELLGCLGTRLYVSATTGGDFRVSVTEGSAVVEARGIAGRVVVPAGQETVRRSGGAFSAPRPFGQGAPEQEFERETDSAAPPSQPAPASTAEYERGGRRRDVFLDDFGRDNGKWPLGSAGGGTLQLAIEDGHYVIRPFDTNPKASWRTDLHLDMGRDFEIETRLRQASGPQNQSQAILWGAADRQNEFRFAVSPSGVFKIYTLERNVVTNLTPWTKSSAIDSGDFTALTVRKQGDEYLFFINHTLVYRMPFVPFFGQQVGFVCGAGTVLEVDAFRVSYLD